MADTTARVQEWRQRLKEEGKTPLTIYLTPDEKLRLRDLADNWHCSVSDMVQQALAAFHPGSPAAPGAVANTAQIRELIREELTHLFPPEVAISLGKHTPADSVTEMFSNVSVTDAPQQASQPPLATADLDPMPVASPLAPVPADAMRAQRRALVLAAVPWETETPEGISPTKLETVTGVSDRDVMNDLKNLHKQGQVKKIGKGRYVRSSPAPVA